MKKGLLGRIIHTFVKITFYILSAIVIYFIILKLTNHSPTTDSVIMAMGTVVLGFIFSLVIKLSKLETKVSYMHIQQNTMAKDLKEVLKVINNLNP